MSDTTSMLRWRWGKLYLGKKKESAEAKGRSKACKSANSSFWNNRRPVTLCFRDNGSYIQDWEREGDVLLRKIDGKKHLLVKGLRLKYR